MSALTPGAIVLSKDINGHRVVFNCLKNFPLADTEVKCFLHFVLLHSYTLSIVVKLERHFKFKLWIL